VGRYGLAVVWPLHEESSNMTVQLDLIVAATLAASEMETLVSDVERILSELPVKASKRIRNELFELATRVELAATALRRELDRPAPDVETVGILAKLGRRAAVLAGVFALGLVGGAGEGIGAEVFHRLVESSKVVQSSADNVDACLKKLVHEPASSSGALDGSVGDAPGVSLDVEVTQPMADQARSELEEMSDQGDGVPSDGKNVSDADAGPSNSSSTIDALIARSQQDALQKDLDLHEAFDSRGGTPIRRR
jgi:hypothetical protein